ncbi:MAG: hypothetical protein IJ696_03385 [Ruminococcus sp.]|nr:hypothetical protein [Ruminococcus sp.]
MNVLDNVMMAAAFDEDDSKERKTRMEQFYVSPILKSLINKECIVSSDELDNERCTVLDVDAEWIMLRIHGKKGDSTFVERISSVDEIQVL